MCSTNHDMTFRVRYSECDPMGVAHHSAYPVGLEMGRTELLRPSRSINYRDLEARGMFLAVVKLEVRYKLPARYDDVLMLRTKLVNAGHVKIEHEYELYRDSILIATASTMLACLDRDGRPRELPAELRTE